MIISISGVPGSGKTSAGRILAEKLGYRFYSIGTLRGKMAMEHGMTLDEWNKLGESDPKTDTSVDEYQRELGLKEDNFIIEGRLCWYFIPHSFKVFLSCDPHESARRAYQGQKSDLTNTRQDEAPYLSIEDAEKRLEARTASDILRYQRYYAIQDFRDPKYFDLVVDTTAFKGPEKTAQRILQELENTTQEKIKKI